MEYRSLGRTGLKVSELCLGAMTFGRECSEELSRQILDRFVAADGNFIDTADVYSRGVSEEILGRWLKGKDRESLVIATKVRFGTDAPNARRPNRFGLSRKHIMAEVDASLRRLQTDYIDLYQVHMWDPNTPFEETLSALNDLVRHGKVRYIGASNYSGWQLQKSVDLSRAAGWEPFTGLQALYNLPIARSNGSFCRSAATRASASSRGARSGAAGSPANTGAAWRSRRKGRASRSPATWGGAKPGRATATSEPGRSSMRLMGWPRTPAKAPRRSHSTGFSADRASPPRSSAPVTSSSSMTISARPAGR